MATTLLLENTYSLKHIQYNNIKYVNIREKKRKKESGERDFGGRERKNRLAK